MSHQLQYTHPPEEVPDSWHLHTTDEGEPQAEHGKTNALILSIAFVASFGFVGLVILLSYLYFQVEMVKRREVRIETTVLGSDARAYKKQSLEQLQGFSFANSAAARAGAVSIPLPEAERRVMQQYGRQGPGGGTGR
jgi:hypothetical protein